MPRKSQVRWHKTRRYWYCQINGHQKYLSVDYATAREKFKTLMAGGTIEPPSNVRSLTRAIELYEDRCSPFERERLKHFIRFAPHPQALDAIPRDFLEQYHRWLTAAKSPRGKPLSPKTIKHDMTVATRLLRWCVDQEWLAKLPRAPKLQKPPQGYKDIPPVKLAELLRSVEGMRVAPLIRFLLATGCRPSEARLLTWAEVDLDRGVCEMERGKTYKRSGFRRVLHLTPPAVEILRRQPKRENVPWVFTSRLHKPYTMSGLRCTLQRVGFPTVYAARHTFAQAALGQVGIEDVAKLLGHSSLATVQIYARVKDERAHRVARSLVPPGSVHSQPAALCPRSNSAKRQASPRAAGKHSRRKSAKGRSRRAG